MKIWTNHGTEHSANLVMIGKFKNTGAAEKAKAAIDEIKEFMKNSDDDHRDAERYSDPAFALLHKLGVHSLGPAELEQFLYDVGYELKDDKIIIGTDEIEISAFLKLLIDNGAMVEVYSRNDYPEKKE